MFYPLTKYYPLAVGNSWHYIAPPRWGGDYISRIEPGLLLPLGKTILHFDATNVAKVLCYLPGKGLYYLGEKTDKSNVEFDQPILWFPDKIQIGTYVSITTGLTRCYEDGKICRGEFRLWHDIADMEDVQVVAGSFQQCLRVVGGTHWDLGDGRQASSETIYHYAPEIGVVKARARFIMYDNQGKETVNRLVETEMKTAVVQGKQIP